MAPPPIMVEIVHTTCQRHVYAESAHYCIGQGLGFSYMYLQCVAQDSLGKDRIVALDVRRSYPLASYQHNLVPAQGTGQHHLTRNGLLRSPAVLTSARRADQVLRTRIALPCTPSTR